jgi:hypothetical protein
MSDVRARAEERRRKILARQNTKVSAVGDEEITPVAVTAVGVSATVMLQCIFVKM